MYKITVALFAYNQEKFIKEAIESVVNQDCDFDYEIIISDDCSKDNTFDIIKNYPYPERILPHLRLIQNETNLGLMDHVDKVFRGINSEWVVMCAGDDISLPNRLSEIAICIDKNKQASAICSQYDSIDECGNIIKESNEIFKNQKQNLVVKKLDYKAKSISVGCTAVYKKEIYDKFGPLNKDFISEDCEFFSRAHLHGDIIRIGKPLLRYRSHRNNLCNKSSKPETLDEFLRFLILRVSDLLKIKRAEKCLYHMHIQDPFLLKKFIFSERKLSALEKGVSRYEKKNSKYNIFMYIFLIKFGFSRRLCSFVKNKIIK